MKNAPLIPASFFGAVLGLVGLGNCWRAAAKVWGLTPVVGEVLMLAGSLVWCLLTVLFLAKWIWVQPEAQAELKHPIFCCFIGLAPLTSVLVALAVAPYMHAAAVVLFVIGSCGQLAFALFRTGQLWKGGRDPNSTTPVLYLPSVAGSFVSSIGASALGFPDWAPLFFGAGMFTWVAIESIIIHRLYFHDMLPKPLRATLGIQLAPPVVGCAAYLSMTSGRPDMFAQLLVGYGLLQALLLIRLIPWLREQPFGPGYWAYTFGVAALSLVLLRFVERGMTGPYPALAVLAFIGANLVIGGIAVASVLSIVRGKYLPPPLLGPSTALPAVAKA